MSDWFAAHIIMYVKYQEERQTSFPVWENIVLVEGQSEDEAFAKAEKIGREGEGDAGGTFRWGGKRATWVFGGVRKLTLCQNSEERPVDGTEVSYIQMKVRSEKSLKKLINSDRVNVEYREEFANNSNGNGNKKEFSTMATSGAHEFRDEQDIIDRLTRGKAELGNWFNERWSLDKVVHDSVGANTYRAFPGTPAAVFRKWAFQELAASENFRVLGTYSSQDEFDAWLRDLKDRLCKQWKEQTGDELGYGPSRKLTDLLLKHFARWSGLKDDERERLITYLHVPLEEYTLVGIRKCIAPVQIPKNPTMSSVSDEKTYKYIQQVIRSITAKAGVPAIYYDILAWNMSH